MITPDKVRLAPLHQLPVLLQMLNLVAVGRGQIRAHAPVVARDHDAAPAGRLRLVVAVVDLQPGLLVGVLQDLRVLVFAHAADEDDRVGREHVLSANSCQLTHGR